MQARANDAAREAIAVPEIPLDAIRRGVQDRPNERAGRRRRGVLAAALASLSIVAVAAAAEMFGHVQISLDPSGTANLYFDGAGGSWRPVRDPKEQDIQKAARAMNFPVILPKGLRKVRLPRGSWSWGRARCRSPTICPARRGARTTCSSSSWRIPKSVASDTAQAAAKQVLDALRSEDGARCGALDGRSGGSDRSQEHDHGRGARTFQSGDDRSGAPVRYRR